MTDASLLKKSRRLKIDLSGVDSVEDLTELVAREEERLELEDRLLQEVSSFLVSVDWDRVYSGDSVGDYISDLADRLEGRMERYRPQIGLGAAYDDLEEALGYIEDAAGVDGCSEYSVQEAQEIIKQLEAYLYPAEQTKSVVEPALTSSLRVYERVML